MKNQCVDETSLSNYMIKDRTIIECYSSCNGYSGSKKKSFSFQNNYKRVNGDNDHCYLPEEIINNFGKNYYFDTTSDKYKNCKNKASFLSTCNSPNSTYCLTYENNHYFVENECKEKNSISSNYFLPNGGDTFEACDTKCNTCHYTKTHCITCPSGQSIFDYDNKCLASIISYFTISGENPSYFKKCDISYKECSNLKDECTEWNIIYYFVGDKRK